MWLCIKPEICGCWANAHQLSHILILKFFMGWGWVVGDWVRQSNTGRPGSCYVTQANLECVILLPQLCMCWDSIIYKIAPHLAHSGQGCLSEI